MWFHFMYYAIYFLVLSLVLYHGTFAIDTKFPNQMTWKHSFCFRIVSRWTYLDVFGYDTLGAIFFCFYDQIRLHFDKMPFYHWNLPLAASESIKWKLIVHWIESNIKIKHSAKYISVLKVHARTFLLKKKFKKKKICFFSLVSSCGDEVIKFLIRKTINKFIS